LRSDVPVGVSLSGGMDSSAITAMVRAVQGPGAFLPTFSYVADDARLSEERWCAIVARETSSVPHLVHVQPRELREDFRQLVRVQEQPFGSPTIYAQYRIYRCAHEAGLKVILSGQGSDQYLGYTRHLSVRLASLLRSGCWLAALRFLRHLVSLPARGALEPLSLIRQILPSRVSALAQVLRRPPRSGLNIEWFRLRGVDLLSNGNSNGYRRLHELLQQNVLQTIPSLLRFEDRNAMSFSVENRVPFLTTKLVDFALSLPE
jgi:asparagine synthase (glutamine-hydrolysing)